jgi:hypothetical protein
MVWGTFPFLLDFCDDGDVDSDIDQGIDYCGSHKPISVSKLYFLVFQMDERRLG